MGTQETDITPSFKLLGTDAESLRHLIISSEIGWRKPSSEFFARACQTLDLPPAQVLIVGDDWENDFVAWVPEAETRRRMSFASEITIVELAIERTRERLRPGDESQHRTLSRVGAVPRSATE